MEENENKNNSVPVDNDNSSPLMPIESLIHVIRGQQVMLDSDLARLYGVETRRLNEQVKRNIERFPDDFMIQLTKEEIQNLISQIATSSLKSQNVISNWGGNRKPPYAFTENGVAMLSSVLRSKTAIEVNIRIMRAFTAMRSFLMSNANMGGDGVSAIIYTDPCHSQISNDLRRHNAQYPRIEVRHCTNVHDRFLIIDDTVYFIGGSIKDLGKKIVAFSQMHQNPNDILSRLR